MIELTHRERDDLLDALMDLKHDLGKYVYLPLAMLERDATGDTVRQAIDSGLRRTRIASDGTTISALEIWRAFLAECGPLIAQMRSSENLLTAVDRALEWGNRLQESTTDPDRDAAARDFRGISEAISQTMEEVSGG